MAKVDHFLAHVVAVSASVINVEPQAVMECFAGNHPIRQQTHNAFRNIIHICANRHMALNSVQGMYNGMPLTFYRTYPHYMTKDRKVAITNYITSNIKNNERKLFSTFLPV